MLVWSPQVLPGTAAAQVCSRNEHCELVSALIQTEKVIKAIKTMGKSAEFSHLSEHQCEGLWVCLHL